MKRTLWMTTGAMALFVAGAFGQEGGSEARYDRQIAERANAELQKAELRNKDKFREITASAEDGIVTLEGTARLFIDKVNAEKKVRRIHNVDGVRNHVVIAGAEVEDATLLEKLSGKLRYDRVGYGIMFNNLLVDVKDGVVKIGGKVRDYPDRDSALAIVYTTPGVKDVIDDIDVASVSGMDDDLRLQLAYSIYGHSALQRYGLDPQAPIRIVVEGGHVELIGVVTSSSDRQVAYSQAMSVPGVFSVTNNIVVAGN